MLFNCLAALDDSLTKPQQSLEALRFCLFYLLTMIRIEVEQISIYPGHTIVSRGFFYNNARAPIKLSAIKSMSLLVVIPSCQRSLSGTTKVGVTL